MRITICGSMSALPEMLRVQQQLEIQGHSVLVPSAPVEGDSAAAMTAEIKRSYIEDHRRKISQSDAILVVNVAKNGIQDYIGANTFWEIGLAHYQQKVVYLLNGLPEQPYIADELIAIEPNILHGELNLIS